MKMKNNTFIRLTIYIIVGSILAVILGLALLGDNGLIRKEINEYMRTHMEETSEQENK